MSLALGSSLPAAAFASVPNTAPTIAPVLVVNTQSGLSDAFLEWTASNKTSSAGFGYKIYVQIDSNPETLASTEGDNLSKTLSFPTAAGETYAFRVVPFNGFGDGPSSNVYSVVLTAP